MSQRVVSFLLLAGLAGLAWAQKGELQVEIQNVPDQLWLTDEETEIDVRGRASVFGGLKHLDMFLILDASQSLYRSDPEDYRLKAAAALVRALPKNGDIQIGVVAFDSRGFLVSPLTSDHQAIQAILEKLADVPRDGGTNLHEGIRVALDGFEGARPDALRVALLFTDGKSDREEAIVAAQEAKEGDVVIHSLLLLDRDESADLLRTIASTTGGTFLYVDNPEKLPKAFLNLHTTGVDHVKLSVNGGPPIDTDFVAGSFAASVPLRPGKNVITARATDLEGHTRDDTVEVTVTGPLSRCEDVLERERADCEKRLAATRAEFDDAQQMLREAVAGLERRIAELDSDGDGIPDHPRDEPDIDSQAAPDGSGGDSVFDSQGQAGSPGIPELGSRPGGQAEDPEWAEVKPDGVSDGSLLVIEPNGSAYEIEVDPVDKAWVLKSVEGADDLSNEGLLWIESAGSAYKLVANLNTDEFALEPVENAEASKLETAHRAVLVRRRFLGQAAYVFNTPSGLRLHEEADVLFRVDPTSTALEAKDAVGKIVAHDRRLRGPVDATTGPWTRCMEAELVETTVDTALRALPTEEPKLTILPMVPNEGQSEDEPWKALEPGTRIVQRMSQHATDWRWRVQGVRSGRTQLALRLYAVEPVADEDSSVVRDEAGRPVCPDLIATRESDIETSRIRTFQRRLSIEVSAAQWVEARLLWWLALLGLFFVWSQRERIPGPWRS